MRTKKFFKTWLAALALTLFAVGAQAQVVLDFSALDSLGTTVTANVGRATGANYVGDFNSSEVVDGGYDTVKFVSTGDFFTAAVVAGSGTGSRALRDIRPAQGGCFATHDIYCNRNNEDVELYFTSTAAKKVEMYVWANNTNSYLFTRLGDGNRYFWVHPTNNATSQRSNWQTGTGAGQKRDIMKEASFSADLKTATYKMLVDSIGKEITVKVEILSDNRSFTPADSLRLSGPSCLKITFSGFDIPKGGKLVWRSPATTNLKYEKIIVYAEAEDATPTAKPTSVEITTPPATIAVGSKYILKAQAQPVGSVDNKRIQWSIAADPDSVKATISAATGEISATKAGNVTVRATAEGDTSVYAEKVVAFAVQAAESVEITGVPVDAKAGVEYTLGSKVLPENTSYKGVSFTIADAGLTGAEITPDGKLTTTAGGTVVVKATVDSTPSITANSSITITVVMANSVAIDNAPAEMTVGDLRTLTATVLPEETADKTIAWSVVSGNEYVTLDADGKLTAIAAGTATVKATNAASGEFDEATITVVAPVIGGTKKEILVLYENFGGNNSVGVDGIIPTAWTQVHRDSCADGADTVAGASGWRDRPEANAGIGGTRASVLYPQITAGGKRAIDINTIVEYKPEALSAITLLDNNAYTYNDVELRNGYKVDGETSVKFRLQNMAVAPGLYQPLCYDTVIAPGGKFTQTAGAGWYYTYQVPYNEQSARYNCADADDKGYLYFANAPMEDGTTANFTIPADPEAYLSDLSTVEFVFSSGRMNNPNVMVVAVEYLNEPGRVDTFTYNSVTYMARKVSIPLDLDNNGNNQVRLRFAAAAKSGNNSAPMGYDYPMNAAITTGSTMAANIQIVEPYTFNRAMVTGMWNGAAYGGANTAMQLHWLKLYALTNDAGYSVAVTDDTKDATEVSKSSNISFGDTVTVSNSSPIFRGWRISGREDLSETASEIKLRVTENISITPLYAGDVAVVAVVDEDFTDWDNKSLLDTAVVNAAAGLIKFTNQMGDKGLFADYGMDSLMSLSIPLRWGFKTPSGADRVNVTLRYCNVVPNSTVRVSNAPGAEQWKGFIGFGARTNADKGYFELDSLVGIQKAVVELSAYNTNHQQNQFAVAVFENDLYIRNVADLKHYEARKAEIALNSESSKLTIGYAHTTSHEFLVKDNLNTRDTFGVRAKTTQGAQYAAMHSLKLYAEVTLPAVSDDNSLRELAVSVATPQGEKTLVLTPEFNPDSLSYTVSQVLLDSVVTISGLANHTAATIGSGDLGQKTLPVGTTTYTIEVTAEDGTKRTYTVKLTRIILSSNANLASLTASGITLSPAFNPAVINYRGTVTGLSSTTIIGVAAEAKATVIGNGEKPLVKGTNVFNVVVVAEDTLVKKTYTVTIMRTDDDATAVAAEGYVVKVYPNPVVNGELTVEDSEWKEGAEIEVYDMSGALAATYTSTGEVTTLNVSRLPNGTYLLKVGKGRAATKFVKQ